MVHKELGKEINDRRAADKDVEVSRFETGKEYKAGETKWIKEQMKKRSFT